MSYYILSDKNAKQIRGIFNDDTNLQTEHLDLIPYYTRRNSNSIDSRIENSNDSDNKVLYLFFQNLDDKIDNIKIFDTIEKAELYREKNNSYGYIMGYKINVIYKNIYDCEYVSLKEIH